MDWFDQQNFPLEFFQSKSTKIFAFQCAFCLEKFEIGLNLEKRLLGHYFTKHYIKDDPAFEFCGIKVEAIELEATDLLKVPNNDISGYDVKDDGNCMDFDDYDNSNSNEETAECTNKQIVVSSDNVNFENKTDNFFCDYCKREFVCKKELHAHILCFHIPYSCTICKQVLKSRISAINHIQNHKINKIIKCDDCGLKYTYQHLKLHKARRTMINDDGDEKQMVKYSCKFCERNFCYEKDKNNHEWQHNFTKEGNAYRCVACKKSKLFTIKQAKCHLKLNHSEGAICFTCGKKFKNKNVLDIHTQTTHLDLRYECDYCGKRFIWKSSIQNHIIFYISNRYCRGANPRPKENERKNNQKKKVWACYHCNIECFNRNQLKAHIDNTHEGETHQFYCRPCKKCYQTDRGRRKHNRVEHGIDDATIPLNHEEMSSSKPTEAKIYYCYPCGKFYSSLNSRRVHNKRRHGISQSYTPLNDERPPDQKSFNKFLHCWTCLRIFATPWNRKGHNRGVHKIDLEHIPLNDERPPPPPEDQYNIKKGTGQFDCKFCKKCYRWRAGRTNHNKLVHNSTKSYIPLNDQEDSVDNNNEQL